MVGNGGGTDSSGLAEDTPSMHELLSMVRKHSTMLSSVTFDEEDVSDVEMDSQFWHDMLDLYFIRGKPSRGRQDDDLIFFVKSMKLHGIGFNDSMGRSPPYFVRRWAPKLDTVLGEEPIDVDWGRSFYLNLIAHTSFTVTVAICSRQALQRRQNGSETPLSSIYKVVKTVYASPSRVDFQLDSKKEIETHPAYPDICFAIDDFDSTFDAVVLTDQDHCYCVLLNAHGGAAFPSDHELSTSDSEGLQFNELTLFSGFVSYKMVREAYDAGRSRLGSLLSASYYPSKTDRLIMRGPGGRGEVEVAVSGVVDQSLGSGPSSPTQSSPKGFGIGLGTFVRKAASAASVAARHAYAATRRSDDELLPLKCCLMSISLPWEQIAHDLLFKKTPPISL
ncbi:hypothetical protein H6P81_020800 [Aristolochia fimbriata]|uniref:Uncharacterized protein n=1 Tax=Aristolochia fimbriata TaxID=158543 RepID=A0AAV7DX76_ARIFI|nr:hypothetical protein H6P81_020800 [Aristolochia fimbriata]